MEMIVGLLLFSGMFAAGAVLGCRWGVRFAEDELRSIRLTVERMKRRWWCDFRRLGRIVQQKADNLGEGTLESEGEG